MENPGYDTRQDLRAVAMVANAPLVLAVPHASPFTRLQDFLDAAAQQPGRLSYASSGTATPGHLAAAKLAADAGLDMTHIPYKGAGAAMTDLIGGQVDCFFASASSVLPHVQGGRLRALAVSTATRVSVLGDIPAVAEIFPGFDFSLWAGVFAQRRQTHHIRAIRRVRAQRNPALCANDSRRERTSHRALTFLVNC